MGHVYKETYTKPLPTDAEVYTRKGENFARWKDRQGKTRTAAVTVPTKGKHAGQNRIVLESATYTAKYRNGTGQVLKVSTGCKTLDAARAVLVELETRADKVRSGNWTAAEDAVLDHQAAPVSRHIDAYLDDLRHKRGKGSKPRVSEKHVVNVKHNLRRIVSECGFKILRDLNRKAVERWVKRQQEAKNPLSARSINAHLVALTAFGNWGVTAGLLVANPFVRPPKLDAKADRRRQRRALADDEIRRLLHVARLRPLAEHGRDTVRLDDAEGPSDKRSRRTWTKAPLTYDTIDAAAGRARERLAHRPDFIAALERTGLERALIYKTLVLTGLRKGELGSLTVGQLELDGTTAYAVLNAVDEKAGHGADVPLRADLVSDIERWVSDRLEAVRADARTDGEPLPARLPDDETLFNVPTGLIRILDRDLAAAGIPKRDERGRTVDVHAMRHTFGTHLSKGGVSPRTAQAAMRHSTLEMTMNTYTDPRLLDVAGAMDALPMLPLDGGPIRDSEKATGTDARTLVPMLVPDAGQPSTSGSSGDIRVEKGNSPRMPVNGHVVNGSDVKSTVDTKRAKGLEPSTFSLEGKPYSQPKSSGNPWLAAS